MPASSSPVANFAHSLWDASSCGQRRLQPLATAEWRGRMWRAVAAEIDFEIAKRNHAYDPDRDWRISWARQLLEWSEGLIPSVDPAVRDIAESLISPSPPHAPSFKELAAGLS